MFTYVDCCRVRDCIQEMSMSQGKIQTSRLSCHPQNHTQNRRAFSEQGDMMWGLQIGVSRIRRLVGAHIRSILGFGKVSAWPTLDLL